MPIKACKVIVKGLVTGVGFRQSVLNKTYSYPSLAGYVRNAAHGEVEIFAQGEPEDLEKLIGWLHVGPRFSRVDELERQDAAIDPKLDKFEIKR